MAVATKLDDGIRPVLMQVFHHTLHDTGHAERLVPAARPQQGEPLDTKNVHIVSFWGTGSKTIRVQDMYLTNNDDYSPQVLTAIPTVAADSPRTAPAIYDLQGRKVEAASLSKGLYIINGRKVVVK
jgi:hypothetical protein